MNYLKIVHTGEKGSHFMQNFQGACSWLELLCVGTSQATAGFDVRLHFLSSVCSSFLLALADGKVTRALSRHPN